MLNQALAKNAIFSGISGIIMLLMKDWFILQIPLPGWLLITISIGLMLFSVQLTLMVIFKPLADKLILVVIFSDIGWIVLTLISLLVFINSLTVIGIGLVILINLIVSLLAWKQFSAYKNEQQTV